MDRVEVGGGGRQQEWTGEGWVGGEGVRLLAETATGVAKQNQNW